MRLIDGKNEHLGIVSLQEALRLAEESGYDLVEVSPAAEPPVAKIIDYGQFMYQQKKLLQKQKAKVKKTGLKGIRLSPRIGKHDLELRQRQAGSFLEDGHKIRIEMSLRGREKSHADLAQEIIDKFIQSLGEDIKLEQPLSRQGGKLSVIIAPKK